MNDLGFYLMLIIFILIILYYTGRYYLRESFEDKPRCKKENDTSLPGVVVLPDRAFEQSPIQKLDDYEYTAIFRNEGSREAGKREISDAMSRYPLSWTNRPPSDETFQDYREAFIDASQKSGPLDTSQFDSISGGNMIPPDTSALEEEEKKLLAMYNPEKPQDLKNYDVENVTDLVKKIYKKRGLLADVEKSNQGQNIYEIVETRPVDEKIVWEDDPPMNDMERSKLRGEQQMVVPQVATDIAAGLDPFFEPRTKVRMDRHDYTKFTPGLERQFAPTYAINSWY